MPKEMDKGLYQRGKKQTWWMDFKLCGHHEHRSCKTTNKAEALKVMIKRKNEILEREEQALWQTALEQDITFSDALDHAVKEHYIHQRQWSTVKSQIEILRSIIGTLRVSMVDDTVYFKVERKLRNKRGIVNNTINKYINVINITLERARRDLKAPCMPMPKSKLKVKKVKVNTISEKIEKKIWNYMSDPSNFKRCYAGWTNEDLLEILTFGLETGMRRGEIFGFRVEQVDNQEILLDEVQHKTSEDTGDKIVPLTEVADQLIKDRIERYNLQSHQRVFPYSASAYTRLWNRMKTQLGIRGKLTPHMMLHTFATR